MRTSCALSNAARPGHFSRGEQRAPAHRTELPQPSPSAKGRSECMLKQNHRRSVRGTPTCHTSLPSLGATTTIRRLAWLGVWFAAACSGSEESRTVGSAEGGPPAQGGANLDVSWEPVAAGQSGSSLDAGAGGRGTAAGQGGSLLDGGECRGTSPQCTSGTSGGQCGDFFSTANCVHGIWECGSGKTLVSRCGCFNSPPTCYQGLARGACTNEIATPSCGGGLWICPEGSVSSFDCACMLAADAGPTSDGGCP
jgi:hypothetical protein